MLKRRSFLQSLALITSWVSVGHAGEQTRIKTNPTQIRINSNSWYMPDENALHKRTWMAFIASYEIWGERQTPEVQRNLATIARTIAKYEPVSILVREQDYETAVTLLGGLNSHPYPIELIEFYMDDLWIRDTGPAFVLSATEVNGKGQKAAINFNFNGWGGDQTYQQDAKVADFVAKTAGVKSIQSSLILEGGCFELDGQGMAIMTESCILNDNRNPGKGKIEVEKELKSLLGLEKIIWLKGIKGKDITDGHTDFYARFIRPGVIVASRETDISSYDYRITRENIEILRSATDADGNSFEIIILDTPWNISTQFDIENFAAGYVGYYVCNGAVIMQKFGDDEADSAAKQTLAKAFPNHQIEQIAIDGIASGGGSIHCATQQEPFAE